MSVTAYPIMNRTTVVELAGKYLLVFAGNGGQVANIWYRRGRAGGLAEALEAATGIDAAAWQDVAQVYCPDADDTVESAGHWILARLEEADHRIGEGIGGSGETAVQALVRQFTQELLAGTLAPMMHSTEVAVVADFLRVRGEPEAADRWLRIHREAEEDQHEEDQLGAASGTAVR